MSESESKSHSVSKWIPQLRLGDEEACQEICQRHWEKVVAAAGRGLRGLPRRKADEEDVAIMAFNAFFRGVEQKRFERLENRQDVWQILAMLTRRMAVSVIREARADKRGGGEVRGESALEGLDLNGSAGPGIQEVADGRADDVEQWPLEIRESLARLKDDQLRQILLFKLEGYQHKEIAERMKISLRSVERKLGLIREIWEQELETDESTDEPEDDDE
jgi:DNA-directed RNA polymerase specialized sigma24 family protein